MKKILLIILFVSLGKVVQSQESIGYSFYTDMNFSRGVEIRPEFRDWYLSFQAEQFFLNEETFFNWGFSLGLKKRKNDFDFFGGVRVGFMNFDSRQTPAFGVELETDYYISESVIIGLRCALDSYADSEIGTMNSEEVVRGFFKIGYKF